MKTNNRISLSLLLGLALLPVRGWTACGDLDPNHGVYYGADNAVRAAVRQSDGKIIIGGWFTSYYAIPRNYIARMSANGVVDSSYNASLNGAVLGLALDPGQNVVAVGPFTQANGYPVTATARFLSNGNYDTLFSSPSVDVYPYCVAVQPQDGKILIGGAFTYVGGQGRPRLARLNFNGGVDKTFNPIAIDGTVYVIKAFLNGRILIGGSFTSINGYSRGGVAWLNPNGSLDTGFPANPVPLANGTVYALDTADGLSPIFLGGNFTQVNGVSSPNLAILDYNGVSATAPSHVPNGTVKALKLMPGSESQSLFGVGGEFTTVGNITSQRFALFAGQDLASCSIDTGFNNGYGGGTPSVEALVLISDYPKRAFCAGDFLYYKSDSRNRVAQILLE